MLLKLEACLTYDTLTVGAASTMPSFGIGSVCGQTDDAVLPGAQYKA